jgi:7 transmembrane helices usually fused to an inactive transglutaminase
MSSDVKTSRSLSERVLPYAATLVGGAGLMGGILLLAGTPDMLVSKAAASAIADPDHHWGLSERFLLFSLPFGAVIVVFVRSMLGWKTFGLFTPMLLAMAYLQSGPVLGPAISMSAILIGMVCAPLLKWLELSRVAFLGALISIVVSGLGALALTFEQFMLASAFPVVVTALIVERWWSTWETDGPVKALKETVTTLFVAVVIQFLIASPLLLDIGTRHPLSIPISAAILMILLGRYKGLRLNELARFRQARSN